MDVPEGATTDYLYYYDEEYGWIHISEVEKLKEAYKRFMKGRKIMVSTPSIPNSFFERLWMKPQSSVTKVNEDAKINPKLIYYQNLRRYYLLKGDNLRGSNRRVKG